MIIFWIGIFQKPIGFVKNFMMKIDPRILRFALSLLIFLHSAFLVEFLHDFFPGIGPISMATYPLTYLIGLIISVLGYKLMIKMKSFFSCLAVFFSLFLLITYIAFDLHESPTVDALKSCKDAIRIMRHPENITYKDIFSENRTYSIAGMVKYKEVLPEYLYSCTYEENSRPFYSFYLWKSGKKIGSNNKYWVIDTLSRHDTVILRDVVKGARYEIIAPPELFSDSSGYLFKEIYGDLEVNFWPISQNMNHGFETWFYRFLDIRWNK
jgi:hypothetical protein